MILTTQTELRNAKHEPGLQFRCGDCNEVKDVQTSGGTGYGYYQDDERPICYECCGKRDSKDMVESGKATLYLDETKREITNWPGTLRFKCMMWHGGNAKKTTNVQFTGPDGKKWVGRKWHKSDHQLINVKRKK